ncbi:MAG: PQQ-binding-like beta-propeller repeat protein [Planctomycetota bacterium]
MTATRHCLAKHSFVFALASLTTGAVCLLHSDPCWAETSPHSTGASQHDRVENDVPDQWREFRGPTGDGHASNQRPPLTFAGTSSSDQSWRNHDWSVDLPGKAWSSPIVVDDQVWLTTAIEVKPSDQERLELLRKTDNAEKKFKQLAIAKSIELKALVVDLRTGRHLRTIELITVQQPDAIHSLNSYASPTPVADDESVYCHFGTFGTFCIDRNTGEIAWQRILPLQHAVGPGSSPILHGNKLVLIQDGMERQYVTALDKSTGQTLWETERPPMEAPSGDQKKAYCTPVAIIDSNGQEQLLCMGSQWMVSIDAESGDERWRLYHGKGFSVVPRPVYADGVVYFATGFGKPQLWAARVDGNGDVTDTHVLWTVSRGIPAKPSPLLLDGLIYVVDDNGVASCFDARDGSQVWKQRFGGKFSSSPVFTSDHLFFGNHDGEIFVITPGPKSEVVTTNHVGDQIMASPVVVEDSMIIRTARSLHRFATGS